MFSKINLAKIVIAHYRTFRSVRSGKIIKGEVFLFFIFPVICGSFTVYVDGFSYERDYVNILIASLSILAGFLFNLIALIFGFLEKITRNAEKDLIKLKLTKEIHANISFAIVLALTCIILLLLCDIRYLWLKSIINALALSFTVAFALCLLMILKRVYILMSKEVE